MLFFAKLTLLRQIGTLVLLSALSLGAGFVFDVYPRLRLSAEAVGKGVVGAALTLLLVAVFVLPFLAAKWSGLRTSLLDARERLLQMSIWSVLGASVTAAAGEELFFRGVVTGGLSRLLPELALAANWLLMLLLYFRGPGHALFAFIKAGECTIYAAMYLSTRSLAAVALCHALVEAAQCILLRSPTAGTVLMERLRFRGGRAPRFSA